MAPPRPTRIDLAAQRPWLKRTTAPQNLADSARGPGGRAPVRQRRNPCQPRASPQEPRCGKPRAQSPAQPARRSADGSGFQPSSSSVAIPWGVAPGWYGCGPLALPPAVAGILPGTRRTWAEEPSRAVYPWCARRFQANRSEAEMAGGKRPDRQARRPPCPAHAARLCQSVQCSWSYSSLPRARRSPLLSGSLSRNAAVKKGVAAGRQASRLSGPTGILPVEPSPFGER